MNRVAEIIKILETNGENYMVTSKQSDHARSTSNIPLELINKNVLDTAVVGAGVSGLITAVRMIKAGHRVTVVDRDHKKVSKLNDGKIPFKGKEGWEKLIVDGLSDGQLKFTTDLENSVKDVPIIFLAVGTPLTRGNDFNMRPFYEILAKIKVPSDQYRALVIRSRVPIGTSAEIEEIRNFSDVILNPDLLHQAKKVSEKRRMLIGVENWWSRELIRKLYDPTNKEPEGLIFLGRKEAEVTCYILATFNETGKQLHKFCRSRGVNIDEIAAAIGKTFKPYPPDYTFPVPSAFEEQSLSHKLPAEEQFLNLHDLTFVFDRSYSRLSHWINEVNLGAYSNQSFRHRFNREDIKAFIERELRQTGWFSEEDLEKFHERVDQKFFEKYRGGTVDALTGFLDKDSFNQVLATEIKKAKGKEEPVSLLMIKLKSLSIDPREPGSMMKLLKAIANIIRKQCGNEASFFHLEKGKFAVILPEISKEQAYKQADQIKEDVEKAPGTQIDIYVRSFAKYYKGRYKLLKDPSSVLERIS